MIVATTNDLAGHRVVRQLGVVRGITVRSRNVISDAIGGVQSMIGGKVGVYVKLAEAARQEAYDDLIAHAREIGANAILAMRYDANEIMPGVTEVLAYGTAVVVEPAA
ncbi:MAG: YbjQ family protein [Bordetella sp.]|nr:YbjQ family protein [Bordetella sp.]